MTRRQGRRQRVRQALLIVSLLLFPVIMYYLSPYVIIFGASQGIVNGSLIMFGLMFVSSLVVGRLWCGWVCPGGALGEVAMAANDRPANGRRLDWIKWLIWAPWIGIIVAMVASAGGYRGVDFFLLTDHGVSVTEPQGYVIYFIVVGLFVGLAWWLGRRAGCHAICWMAPFMILGRALRNTLAWPSLRLRADKDACTNCRRCTVACPMSLDVNGLVQKAAMEHSECILCGSCVDTCPQDVIRYTFSVGR
ncbi:MAG: 4Fe-4S binding protein [Anaerolineae bacterium]